MATPIDDMKFKQDLMQDLSESKETAEKSRASLGVRDEIDPMMNLKAIRTKDRTLGRKELAEANRAINDTIEELLGQTGIRDELEEQKFRIGMGRKMNQFKMLALKQALALQKKIDSEQLDQEQSQALMGGLGKAVSGIASNAIAGLGKRLPDMGLGKTTPDEIHNGAGWSRGEMER